MRPASRLAAGLLVLVVNGSFAQADPTRPPVAWLAPASAASAPRAAASAPVPRVLRVSSVQLPRDGASSAIVDDRVVHVGDRIGDRSIASIDAEGVLLRDGKGRTARLRLLDAEVVMQAIVTTPGATFSHSVTLNIYAPGAGTVGSGPGALLMTKTQTFAIPWMKKTPAPDALICATCESTVGSVSS